MVATQTLARQIDIYQHQKGKYTTLNDLNKTPIKFVKGRRYRVGTGIIFVRSSSGNFNRVIVSSKSHYKKFLREVINIERANEDLVAFQWIPVRVLREQTLTNLKCNTVECTPPECHCKQPGCICQPNEVCGP